MTPQPVSRPASRPELARALASDLLRAAGCTKPLAILLRRGYYRDALGIEGKNDIGIYDDAAAVLSPRGFWTFNANCDPSKAAEGTAILQPGVYLYAIGTHNLTKEVSRRYPAFVQAQPVCIRRVGREHVVEVGFFGINGHKGGIGTTGSEGCWTIVPDQWDEFFARVREEMELEGVKTIPVVLTVREES